MTLLKVSDNYSAVIVGNFSDIATTITVDVAPVKTSGYLTVFDLNGNQLEKIKYTGVSGLNLTGCVRGLSFDNNFDTPVDGNAKVLSNGMTIAMTVSQHYINPVIDVVNGTTASGGVMKNPATRTISDSRHLVDKEYADGISAAGITSMLVSDNGGVTVNVNSGTYILNGAVYYYAGAAAQALTNNATNYIQLKDGVLDIQTDAFDDDCIPLATVICASGDITSLLDRRPFYTGTDLRQNTAAYLTGGTSATSVVATWTAVNNGSFRVTIDGVAHNVDTINFSSGVTTMADVATKIQTALRAATSGNETVVWSTNHFTITSGTTGSTSQISVLSTSTGTVGTDISGLGATNFIDGDAGHGVATAGLWSGLGRDTNGIYIDLSATPGLEVVGGKLQAKIKTAGGLVRDANGLSVDTTVYPLNTIPFVSTTSTGTAAEVLATGNLYRLATTAGAAPLSTTANGTNTGFDFDSQGANYALIAPLDLSIGYYKLNSTSITFGTVTSGGNVTVKLYEYFNAWTNGNPTTTLSGANVLATSTLSVTTTGAKTFSFSSTPILDFVNHKYAIAYFIDSGSFSNITPFGGVSFDTTSGNGYKWFNSINAGSTWLTNYNYVAALTVNVDMEIVGAVYKATTTVVDGVVTTGGAVTSTVNLQSAGMTTLATTVAGKMYYSDGSGAITATPDGTKLSIGFGIDSNKILIVKGVK